MARPRFADVDWSRLAGISNRHGAAQLGIHPSTYSEWRQRAGIPPVDCGHREASVKLRQLTRDDLAHHTDGEIAAKLGVAADSVRRHRRDRLGMFRGQGWNLRNDICEARQKRGLSVPRRFRGGQPPHKTRYEREEIWTAIRASLAARRQPTPFRALLEAVGWAWGYVNERTLYRILRDFVREGRVAVVHEGSVASWGYRLVKR